MGLLYKRPLALFCTCFLSALYISFYVTAQIKIRFVIIFSILAVVFILLAFWNKKRRILWVTVTVCILAIAMAFLHMYLRIDRREEKALGYTGDRTVECQVLSEVMNQSGHSEYIAELLQVGEDKTHIRTYLICGFSGKLHAGDRFIARVELFELDALTYGVRAAERVQDSRILLTTVLHESKNATLTDCAKNDPLWMLLSLPNGIELVSDRLRMMTASVFDQNLGDEISPLARSFFIGDKSDLSPRVIRDFRRTGTSHMLAVSGLHIVILLGGLEWILRKLTLSKILRISIVSVSAILLLMMTGFAMSACRSVLMLFAVYLHYLFARENDGVTSLLVSVCLIILISADAFFDLGLWMSFFATLGLLTVYPLLDARVPRKKFKNFLVRSGFRILRGALMIALMSTVTGLFLLPIQWSVFGELSLMAIPANVVLSSITAIFLYAIPLALLLSPIPWLGECACRFLTEIGRVITIILNFFARQNFAMLSLRYVFADVIIPLLSVCMLILLLVRLRHKWIFAIPPVIAAVCFTVCLFITFYKQAPIVSDYTNGDQRVLSVVNDGEAVLCDISCERAGAYFDVSKELKKQGATDIDTLVLGHLSEELPEMLQEFLPYTVVHRIYLPKLLLQTNLSLAKEIFEVVEGENCEVVLYEDEIVFSVLSDTLALIHIGRDGELAALDVDCEGQCLSYLNLSYMEASKQEKYIAFAKESHTAWFSFTGCEGKEKLKLSLIPSRLSQIIVDRPHRHKCAKMDIGDIPLYEYPNDRKKRFVSFFLEP